LIDVAFGVVEVDALIGEPCFARDHVIILDPTCEVQPRNDIPFLVMKSLLLLSLA
jgi:hypothetical protein